MFLASFQVLDAFDGLTFECPELGTILKCGHFKFWDSSGNQDFTVWRYFCSKKK
jgi:hypothetical protein